MPSRIDRISRLERLLAERPPLCAIDAAEAVIAFVETSHPNAPLVRRWRSGDRSLADMIAVMGPSLTISITEAELKL